MNKYYYKDEVIDEDDLIEELYNHYIQENNEMSHEQIMDIVMYDVNNNFMKYNIDYEALMQWDKNDLAECILDLQEQIEELKKQIK